MGNSTFVIMHLGERERRSTNCPYCKDPDFNKIVAFPQHGNGKSAKREVEKYFTRAEIYLMELERDMANLEFKRNLVDFYF